MLRKLQAGVEQKPFCVNLLASTNIHTQHDFIKIKHFIAA